MIGALIAGLSAGAIHVLAGPDHLAAVAPLAADRHRRPWTAGMLWGLGHAGGVLLVGIAALVLREVLPLERLSASSERLVGLVLIGIGVWGIRQAARLAEMPVDEFIALNPGFNRPLMPASLGARIAVAIPLLLGRVGFVSLMRARIGLHKTHS